jgi:hypothetical protein
LLLFGDAEILRHQADFLGLFQQLGIIPPLG